MRQKGATSPTAMIAAIVLVVGLVVGAGIGSVVVPPKEVINTAFVTKEVAKEVVRTATATVQVPQPEKKVKVAFVYVGPIGDYGWTHAHDQARQALTKKFSWVETVFAESVPEGPDAARFIERFAREGADVVFTTSFGFMDPTVEVAKKFPEKVFIHVSGFKRDKNVGNVMADFYQLYYLNGLMAGALTKSNKLGYVAAHPIPEVVRHINAFALGAKEANPKATVEVVWLFSWYDPTKARAATESLIAKGVDVLAFTEDSPTVIEVAQEHFKRGKEIYAFSHYSPMQKFGPDVTPSGQLVRWEVLYERILADYRSGALPKDMSNYDIWGLLRDNAVVLGGEFGVPINPKMVSKLKEKTVTDPLLGTMTVFDLVNKRLQQMSEFQMVFDPFAGPIKDQTGKVRIPAGIRATYIELLTMDYFVDNVIGTIPKQ